MDRNEIIAKNPIVEELERRGVQLIGNGKNRTAKCPFHEDKSPSFSVDTEKQVWFCHAGCGGGSVIDLIAKFEARTPESVMKELGGTSTFSGPPKSAPKSTSTAPGIQDAVYSYRDAMGKEAYQVVRYVPKTFRQRHSVDGKWVWGMEGVERILYRLPEVLKAEKIWINEGERDVESLVALGFCATTNSGGAKKWMDAYSESLRGKDVAICGDNDAPGKEHVEMVFESLAGKVKTARIIELPPNVKDVTDYIKSHETPEEAKASLERLWDEAHPFTNGLRLPLYTMAEIERNYSRHVKNLSTSAFNIGLWLPSLGRAVRSLVPGELVSILADTGVGKTAMLQNIAVRAAPLPTILFELELPQELVFERFMCIRTRMTPAQVEQGYATEQMQGPEWNDRAFPKLLVCTEASLSLDELEKYIVRSEAKLGEKPKLVLIDYIQLFPGKGSSRYERVSSVAEGLKVVAKRCRVIIVVASQVHRKEDESPEIFLHDAKDSGSIENSSGLVIGAWRDSEDAGLLYAKICKNTKGKSGVVIKCNYDGERLIITERVIETESTNRSHPD